MPTVSVKEARQKFARLVEAARRGSSVTITRRGKQVAKLTGVATRNQAKLPDLAAFRASLSAGRKGRATTVAELRRAERY